MRDLPTATTLANQGGPVKNTGIIQEPGIHNQSRDTARLPRVFDRMESENPRLVRSRRHVASVQNRHDAPLRSVGPNPDEHVRGENIASDGDEIADAMEDQIPFLHIIYCAIR